MTSRSCRSFLVALAVLVPVASGNAQELSFDLGASPVQSKSLPYDATEVLVLDLTNANTFDFDYLTNMRVSGLAPQPRIPGAVLGSPLPSAPAPPVSPTTTDESPLGQMRTQLEASDPYKALPELSKARVTGYLKWKELEEASKKLEVARQARLEGTKAAVQRIQKPLGRLAELRERLRTWRDESGSLKKAFDAAVGQTGIPVAPSSAPTDATEPEKAFWQEYFRDRTPWGNGVHAKLLSEIQPALSQAVETEVATLTATDLGTLECAVQAMERLEQRRTLRGQAPLENWHRDAEASLRGACPVFWGLLDLEWIGATEPWLQRVPQDKVTQALASTGAGGGVLIEVDPLPLVHSLKWIDDRPALERSPEPGTAVDTAIKEHAAHRVYRVVFGNPPGVLASFGPFVSGLGRVEYDRFKNPDYDPAGTGQSELIVGKSEDSSITYGIAAYWSAALRKQENWGVSWGIAYTPQNDIEQAVSGLVGGYWRPYKSASALVHFGALIGQRKELASSVAGQDPVPIGANETIPVTQKTVATWYLGIGFGFFGGQ
jgi:hypothetical protein